MHEDVFRPFFLSLIPVSHRETPHAVSRPGRRVRAVAPGTRRRLFRGWESTEPERWPEQARTPRRKPGIVGGSLAMGAILAQFSVRRCANADTNAVCCVCAGTRRQLPSLRSGTGHFLSIHRNPSPGDLRHASKATPVTLRCSAAAPPDCRIPLRLQQGAGNQGWLLPAGPGIQRPPGWHHTVTGHAQRILWGTCA